MKQKLKLKSKSFIKQVLRPHKSYSKQHESSDINWSLFVVLLTVTLLFRLVFIFGLVPALNCVSFSEFWMNRKSSGFTLIEGFLLIYLLTSLWALMDIIKSNIIKFKKSHLKSTKIIQYCFLVTSLLFTYYTYRIYTMSVDVNQILESQAKTQTEQVQKYKKDIALRYCTQIIQ